MTTRTITNSFQHSSEANRERMLLAPRARLDDITPTKGDPAQITALLPGTEVCGTVYNPGTTADPYVLLNVAEGRMERQNVRNVLTYSAGPVAEATWGPMNFGDPVFYDTEQDTLNGIKLSTAPLQSDGTTLNPRFGTVIMLQSEDKDDFAKGTDASGVSVECGVLCCGMNHLA